MGDLLSSSKSDNSNKTTNAQVSQQGSGIIGISSSNIGGNLTVESLDGKLAADVVSSASAAVTQALNTLQHNQDRALDSVDASVASAQQTALTATPIPAGNLSLDNSKNLTTIALGLAAIGALVLLAHKK